MFKLGELQGTDHPTVVIHRRVRPGMEEAFLAWSAGIGKVTSEAPGCLGCQMVPPVEGAQEEWVFVFHFDTPANLKAWIQSETRATWLAVAEPMTFGPGNTHIISGLQSLFGILPPDQADPPAVWKLALITELGLFPTALLVAIVLGPAWAPWPLWLRVLTSTALSVGLMTWGVMPLVTRAFLGWLQPGTRSPAHPQRR